MVSLGAGCKMVNATCGNTPYELSAAADIYAKWTLKKSGSIKEDDLEKAEHESTKAPLKDYRTPHNT